MAPSNIQDVTKIIELDYGHTLPNHFGFCNQIHGHRGRVEATFRGEIVSNPKSSSQGMVMDFKEIKKIMMEQIHDKLDHGFAVWKEDTSLLVVPVAGNDSTQKVSMYITTLDFIKARNKKYLVTEEPPTAEYLSKWAFEQINEGMRKYKQEHQDIKAPDLYRVRWYETPNSWADTYKLDRYGEI